MFICGKFKMTATTTSSFWSISRSPKGLTFGKKVCDILQLENLQFSIWIKQIKMNKQLSDGSFWSTYSCKEAWAKLIWYLLYRYLPQFASVFSEPEQPLSNRPGLQHSNNRYKCYVQDHWTLKLIRHGAAYCPGDEAAPGKTGCCQITGTDDGDGR